jgi:hypothetical protein
MIATAPGFHNMAASLARQLNEMFGFDEGINDRSRSGLHLAQPAMTVVDEYRRRRDLVTNRSASAAAGQSHFSHRHFLTYSPVP